MEAMRSLRFPIFIYIIEVEGRQVEIEEREVSSKEKAGFVVHKTIATAFNCDHHDFETSGHSL